MSTTPSASKVRLAAYILTLNEEHHIATAVRSLMQVTEHVMVIDSMSTDDTVDEASRAGADALKHSFQSFGKQRNFAVECLVTRYNPDWILTIDADETLSPTLVRELRAVLLESKQDPPVDAYTVPLRIRFEGRSLRHGGLARSRLLRVYRPAAGHYEIRSVNEHFELHQGKRLGGLSCPIDHNDITSWERHVSKHNRYSTLEARERASAATGANGSVSAAEALRAPYLRRRWLREQVWNRLPAKPFLRFLQMYVFSCGFLDGRPGFDIAVFHAWQELCTEQKYREIMSNGASTTSQY